MPDLILIETSTSLCSAALARNGKIVCSRESAQPRAHASMTAPFVKQLLDEAGMKAEDLDAVCVSSGPGSYTGLRVGVSTAKGLCFATGRPLVSVNTLDILVNRALRDRLLPEGCRYVIPMIDARRMEVYTRVYRICADAAVPEGEISPVVVDGNSFAAQRGEGPVLFIGDGAQKCSEVLAAEGATFFQTMPDATAMLEPALDAWNKKRFEDTAYFEPFYLKQFVATVSRKNLF